MSPSKLFLALLESLVSTQENNRGCYSPLGLRSCHRAQSHTSVPLLNHKSACFRLLCVCSPPKPSLKNLEEEIMAKLSLKTEPWGEGIQYSHAHVQEGGLR